MLFELGLKKDIKKEGPKNYKTNFKYSESNIGYDSAFSKRLVLDNPKDIFQECALYYLFDKKEPKMLIRDLVKLSAQEKGVFKKFFDFLKELPISNTKKELESYFLQFLEEVFLCKVFLH